MLNLQLPRAVGAWLGRLTGQERAASPSGALGDTVALWPPTPAQVLASTERHAHKHLVQALALEHPKGFLLAHVPLYKLVRVPRGSYREWLSRTGLLTVDFALCDEHGYVRSVVLMPLREEQQQRLTHKRQRLLRVLGATDLPVVQWDRELLGDDAEQLRRTLFPKPHGAGHYTDTPHSH